LLSIVIARRIGTATGSARRYLRSDAGVPFLIVAIARRRGKAARLDCRTLPAIDMTGPRISDPATARERAALRLNPAPEEVTQDRAIL